jgi:hypothetical protein
MTIHPERDEARGSFAAVKQLARSQGPSQDLSGKIREILYGSSTLACLNMAFFGAGTKASQGIITAHCGQVPWGGHVPLSQQEYRTILGEEPAFETSTRQALAQTQWADGHLRDLMANGAPAARRFVKDLTALHHEAVAMVQQLGVLRKMIDPPFHPLQIQALMRALQCVPDLKGLRVLEVGCGDGGLFRELTRRGANVTAVDVAPEIADARVRTGDFMKMPDLPDSFDLVMATAVFELGSGWTPSPLIPEDPGAQLLARLRQVTHPGSLVVMENIGFPILFSAAQARAAGFIPVMTPVPAVNTMRGGRGCTLRRQ